MTHLKRILILAVLFAMLFVPEAYCVNSPPIRIMLCYPLTETKEIVSQSPYLFLRILGAGYALLILGIAAYYGVLTLKKYKSCKKVMEYMCVALIAVTALRWGYVLFHWEWARPDLFAESPEIGTKWRYMDEIYAIELLLAIYFSMSVCRWKKRKFFRYQKSYLACSVLYLFLGAYSFISTYTVKLNYNEDSEYGRHELQWRSMYDGVEDRIDQTFLIRMFLPDVELGIGQIFFVAALIGLVFVFGVIFSKKNAEKILRVFHEGINFVTVFVLLHIVYICMTSEWLFCPNRIYSLWIGLGVGLLMIPVSRSDIYYESRAEKNKGFGSE